MLTSPTAVASALVTVALANCCLLNLHETAAQSPPLIVVTDASDAACVKRIGCGHVHVETLFPRSVGRGQSYRTCDERIRQLLEFRLLVLRGDTTCPRAGFWQARLCTANPTGKVHRLAFVRHGAASACELQMRRATEIHGMLAAILPQHRASLDANLKAELNRLRFPRPPALELALTD